MRNTFFRKLFFHFCGLFLLSSLAGAQSNDDFANATTLSGDSGTVYANNVSASWETGEPAHAFSPALYSLWWKWTAPSDGVLSLDTAESDFLNVLAVYTGDAVNALTEVASGVPGGNEVTSLSPPVVGGTTYHIVVDGYYGMTGNITLNWSFTGSVGGDSGNDDFTNAVPLTVDAGTMSTNSALATAEDGEPAHAGFLASHSMWWSWSRAEAGTVVIDTRGSVFDTALAIYTGTAVNSLILVASNDDAEPPSVVQSEITLGYDAGVTYYIAVDGIDSNEYGGITLNWQSAGPLDNDAFANAEVISGTTGTVSSINSFATPESNEPDHAGTAANHSLWWTWTAPTNGTLEIDTHGSSFDTVLAIYTGTRLRSLTPVRSNDDDGSAGHTSGFLLPVQAGTTYAIAVDSFVEPGTGGFETGPLLLNWLLHTGSLPNDDFAAAIPLAAGYGTLHATNILATAEPGEQNHSGSPPEYSLWWSWTAPEAGPWSIDTHGSDFDTVLGINVGSSVDTLLQTNDNDDDSYGYGNSGLQLNAVAGVTYYVVVDGKNGEAGNITLNWRFSGSTPTVDFTTPSPLVLPYGTTNVTLEGINNSAVMGDILWTNLNAMAEGHGAVDRTNSLAWTVNVTGLVAGGNWIEVTASNSWGLAATSQLEIQMRPPVTYASKTGANIHPYASWENAALDIQDAIDVVDPNGTVYVGPGTYLPGGRIVAGDQLVNRIVATTPVTIIAEEGPGETVIEGESAIGNQPGFGAKRCAYLDNGATLAGFTLRGGYTEIVGDVDRDQSGGGAMVLGGAVVSNCVIESSVAYQNGGGLFIRNSVVSRCRIRQNQSRVGGGLYAMQSQVDNSAIYTNRATIAGAGLYSENSTLQHCTIARNDASGASGGGIYAASNIVVRYSIIMNNDPSNWSIGIADSAFENCNIAPLPVPATVTDCLEDDPLFADPAGLDFRLSDGSPCIDAATGSPFTIDIQGRIRPLDGDRDEASVPDLGAFEFDPPSRAWPGAGSIMIIF